MTRTWNELNALVVVHLHPPRFATNGWRACRTLMIVNGETATHAHPSALSASFQGIVSYDDNNQGPSLSSHGVVEYVDMNKESDLELFYMA